MSGCAAEDSVQQPYPSSNGGAGGAGGTSGAGVSGMGGAAGTLGGVGGGGTGGIVNMMAGVGGGGVGGNAGVSGVGGEAGGGTDGGTGGGGGAAQDADCDMNGIWIARMMTVQEALSLEQCGSNYFYLELKQEGADVEVVNSMHCGIEGRGSSNGTLSDAAILALTKANRQIGRKGTMTKGADGTCQFTMEKFWAAFGADEAAFVPTPRNSDTPFAQVQMEMPLPTTPAGAFDTDGDGNPGLSIIITGAIQGTRFSVQRNNYSWLTNDRYKITPALDWTSEIEARADFVGEETVVGTMPDDGLLSAGSNGVPNAKSARVTLKFLGRNTADPRVSAIVTATDPMTNPDGVVQSCKNIINALPPINAISDGFIGQLCPCPGDVDGQPVCQ